MECQQTSVTIILKVQQGVNSLYLALPYQMPSGAGSTCNIFVNDIEYIVLYFSKAINSCEALNMIDSF
jgi:hypothetical protein